jgi:prepilin-type N-terminal cleavage/methylation domain-containing protein
VNSRRDNSAFTLLELVIVLAVMGIILAVTAPDLARFLHGRTVREEARRFVAVTQRAAAYATTHSCRTTVWVDLDVVGASGETEGVCEYGWRRVESFDEEEVGETSFQTPTGMTVSITPTPDDSTWEITFGPDGSVEVSDDLVVCFAAGPGDAETASVSFDEDRGIFLVQGGPDDEEGDE